MRHLFAAMHDPYPVALMVTSQFERLRLLSREAATPICVATLPTVVPFDDPTCAALYDRVLATGDGRGFGTTQLVDAFDGEDHRNHLKAQEPDEVTHPNADEIGRAHV